MQECKNLIESFNMEENFPAIYNYKKNKNFLQNLFTIARMYDNIGAITRASSQSPRENPLQKGFFYK